MFVYLAHHGHAVGPEVDTQRPLSSRGRDQVQSLSRLAAERAVRPEVVWHSGKLRARQTAEAYWSACNPLADFSASRWMQPGDPPRLADLLEVESRDVLLAGHMPHLDRLRRRLVGDSDAGAPFPMNGLVAVERTQEGWRERWRLAPPPEPEDG
jgi:phosphohistidine phosphatase